jgi:hypothetical protein
MIVYLIIYYYVIILINTSHMANLIQICISSIQKLNFNLSELLYFIVII